MGVYVYCIVRTERTPPPQATGIADAAVEAAAAGAIGCWLSRHEERPAVSAAAVQQHDQVVRAAMSREHTPVPVRFGQWFADTDEACTAIAADAARWQELLARFEGAVEYGVRVARRQTGEAARDVRPAAVGTGTAYMTALARREADVAQRWRDGQTVAAWILDRLGPVARESRMERSEAGAGLVNLAVLVAWPDADAYHTVVQGARAARVDLLFLASGPWPPYSFVS